jgi:hypothetical protein
MHACRAGHINSKDVPDIPDIHCPLLQPPQQSNDTHCHCCWRKITGITGVAGIVDISQKNLDQRASFMGGRKAQKNAAQQSLASEFSHFPIQGFKFPDIPR